MQTQNIEDLSQLESIAKNTLSQWIQNQYLDDLITDIEFTAKLFLDKAIIILISNK